jgi:hypothetical protein
MNDSRLGYPPAAHEDYRALHASDFEGIVDYPLGVPTWVCRESRRRWDACRARHRVSPLVRIIGDQRMTAGDRAALHFGAEPLGVSFFTVDGVEESD